MSKMKAVTELLQLIDRVWSNFKSYFWVIIFIVKLNKYLFNTVNNKELGHGQRSVVWLKHGQPYLHELLVLSTVFSWRPLSSFRL